MGWRQHGGGKQRKRRLSCVVGRQRVGSGGRGRTFDRGTGKAANDCGVDAQQPWWDATRALRPAFITDLSIYNLLIFGPSGIIYLKSMVPESSYW